MADTRLGFATALAIVAHEIPQEVGDYIVLLNAGLSRAKALLFNAISGMAAVVGGVLGYWLIGSFDGVLPYLLVLASSSFIYISVADLLPQLQQRLALRETLAQVLWLAVGLGVAFAVAHLLHGAH
jgi:zinc and cadmium transporter